MPPKSSITANNLVEAKITKRSDEYIMLTKRELKMADNTTKAIDVVSELLIIIASALFGYILNMDFNISKNTICILVLMLILGWLGFQLKQNKKTLISEILETAEIKKEED